MIPSTMTQHDFQKQLEQFNFIRLVMCDLNGMHLSKLVPVRYAKKIAQNSCDAYVGLISFGAENEIIPLEELEQANFGNGPLMPDPRTLRPLPWAGDEQVKIAEVNCESLWENGQPIEAHPRFVARKQLAELHAMGFDLFAAYEPEFRVFQEDKLYTPVTVSAKMYRTGTLMYFEKFFTHADKLLQQAGIEVQDYLIENGQSQLETPLVAKYGIEAADMAFSFRQAMREIAHPFGYKVSYMSKPLPNDSGNGWHFNHSLVTADTHEPVMYDDKEENHISPIMLHWVAGILEHLKAILAFASPTVNCYRRLHRHVAPSKVDWDINSRFKSVRVKNNGASGTYVELRIVSSAACVYNVLAATVAAGVDGIKRKLLPPPVSAPGAKLLPATLAESLDALESDSILVEALGPMFVKWFLRMKRESCVEKLKDVDLDTETEESLLEERKRYFEFI